ncbi:DUF1638 domain-containing protein [Sporomusa acidovorans]|uniref:DUF1638 domain-containing protein n=1 Tax=Sporomusa acidovorans (strain ATCC 49682 / DSM 3132 / Mol) TaxID=1123286 RepID=A0ABZ3IYA0_SPOA4|nr:DUF1638 domain-containing protein [Sporomusa acidovorans]OZC22390.1 hypothetical protein SPACI_14390 [Sporomusa acidovorans DSM 3132]SDE47798.1 Protein of unknown function [Sporomusa acidovorans]
MRIKLIGCHSTRNEVLALGVSSEVDCEFLDFSFHADPLQLHRKLQSRINACQHYDQIILTYGRCAHAVAGLASPRVPLILPKAHDCISLLLGSDVRRQALNAVHPSVYYFSQGWLQYGRDPYTEYCEYRKRYGEKDAAYLIRSLYGNYQEAMFIQTVGEGAKLEKYRQRVSLIANFFGWKVREVTGDLTLLKAVISRQRGPDVMRVAPGTPIVLEEESHYAD